MLRRVVPGLRVAAPPAPASNGARVTPPAAWPATVFDRITATPTRVLLSDPLRFAVEVTITAAVTTNLPNWVQPAVAPALRDAGVYVASTFDDVSSGRGILLKPGSLPWNPANTVAELWAMSELAFLTPLDLGFLNVDPIPFGTPPTPTLVLTSVIRQFHA